MGLKSTTACLGFDQRASLAASTALNIPVDPAGRTPTLVVIHAESQPVRWRDDGVAPTAAVGMRLVVGQELRYDGDLTKIRFIEEAASAKINCSYYE